MRKRKNMVVIRLNDDELNRFNTKAQKSGLTKQAYFIQLIKGYVPKEAPPLDYYKMMNELHRIGNNLNQIAYMANATGKIDAEEYEKNVDLLKKKIKEISKAVLSPERIRSKWETMRANTILKNYFVRTRCQF